MPSTAVSHRAVVIAAVLAVLAVVIATGSWLATGAADSQPIGHNASERVADLDGLAATVETTTVRDNRTTTRLVQRVERLFRRLDVSPEAVNRTQRANTTVQVSPLQR